MNSKIGIIIRREYLERVTKKSFIFSTILMPLFMVGMMIAPALLTVFNTPELKKIAIIDNSGIIAPNLKNCDGIEFILTIDSLEVAKANENLDGILVIDEDILTSTHGASLYTHEASSMLIEDNITNQLEKAIENKRLKNYEIEDLDKQIKTISL